jgi:hypothetical protein
MKLKYSSSVRLYSSWWESEVIGITGLLAGGGFFTSRCQKKRMVLLGEIALIFVRIVNNGAGFD